ncbi:MAG: hypothetical protein GY858_01615 [Candidatus Omnitrophica bacterium]|nr:hypothetical protein [Candidatus Omnitrophota bacterium]
MAWWLIVIAFPTVLSASLPNDIARLAFTIENQNFYSFAFFGNLIAVSIIAVFLCSCFSKNMAKNNRKQCFLLLAMILAYTYVILPGRLPTYGLNWTLTSFGYYTYVFLSLILIFIVSVCDFSRLKPFKRNILIIVLLVMLSININKTYNLCNYIKKITTEKRAYFDKLNSFVKKYSHDQDFSFAVTNDMFYVSKYPDVTLALPLSAIFYDQYINYKNPKYIVTMEGREVEQKEQDIYRK